MKLKSVKYCLELSNRDIITPLGLPVFIAMSTRHFELLFNFMGCNFDFDSRLKRISQDFVENALPAVGISTPLKQVSKDIEDIDLYLSTWRTTFEKLDAIGYGEYICNWIQKLRVEKENKLHIRLASGAPLWLLRDWSMDSWQEGTLNLSNEKIQQIKLITLQTIVKKLEWQDRLNKTTQDVDFDIWEEFVYKKQGGEVWMLNQIAFHRRFSMWVSIFDMLTEQELTILSQWLESEIQSYVGFVDTYNDVDLIAFSNDLRELGYLDNCKS